MSGILAGRNGQWLRRTGSAAMTLFRFVTAPREWILSHREQGWSECACQFRVSCFQSGSLQW